MLIALFLVITTCSALDTRALTSGSIIGNITSGYSDQPQCLVRQDGAWLCTVTYNNLPEGSAGEHVITTISTDHGKTWTPRQPVEPGQTLQYAYSTLFQGKDDTIFIVYVENSDNVTSLNGDVISRRDMFGHFWLRRSTDGGATWGNATERWEVPVRMTTIDRENSWKGATRIQWMVDKGFTTSSGGVYVMFAKVGTYVVNPPTSSWMLHSANLMLVDDPANIVWETLPKGDDGVHNWDPTAPGVSEEPHVVPMSDDNENDMYMVFRTTEGVLGARVSYDGGASFEQVESSTGTTLEKAAQYWDESGQWKTSKPLKHPRGPPTPRNVASLSDESGTEYLLLYYNNGNTDFLNRNPYWLVPGWKVANSNNGSSVHSSSGNSSNPKFSIQWGQPEIALYGIESKRGPGYPDFIIDATGKNLYITETEKIHCRLHQVSDELLTGLLHQRSYVKDVTTLNKGADVLLSLSAPLPAGTSMNLTLQDKDLVLSNSFSILAQFSGSLRNGGASGGARGGAGAGAGGGASTLFSTVRADSEGKQTGIRLVHGLLQETVILEVGRLSSAHCNIPFRFVLDQECTEKLNKVGSHFMAISVDEGPAVITAMVDGVLCDGGLHQVQGWVEMPRGVDDPLQFVDGWMSKDVAGVVGPMMNVELTKMVVMNRYLRTTEMLGTFRAWKN